MDFKLATAAVARRVTRGMVFRKRLPATFGGGRFYATSRVDIRLLLPGVEPRDLLEVAERYVQPGNVVWDIGSNLGIFSWCAAWKAGQSGRVYTLEADYYYAELQHRTARQLGSSYAPVVPLCAAAAAEPGILDLAISARGESRNHLVSVADHDRGGSRTIKSVVALTGDFLSQHWQRPDFVKIDIEGAELLFLTGATKLLESHRPLIYIEVSSSNKQDVTRVFKQHDYRLFKLDGGREVPIERCEFNTLARPA